MSTSSTRMGAPSREIRGTTSITLQPFGGGAPLASATFTPHGTTNDDCCHRVTSDPMSISIP